MKDAPFHESLLQAALVDLEGLRVGLEGALIVPNALEGVSLPQEAETVVCRGDLDCLPEVRQRFVPFPLENIDLTTREVGFDVLRVLDESLA